MNWYIGMEVVALINHSQKAFKKGQVFKIQGIMKLCCNVVLDIGLKHWSNGIICSSCDKFVKMNNNAWWFNEKLFAPLEYNQDAINELLEQTKV